MTDCREQPISSDFSELEDSRLYAPASSAIEPAAFTSTWSPPITRLLAAGYSFLANSYTEDGFLFRGMESGITESITTGYFGHFDGSREESRVESIMNICFLTHEIRDALTVADLETKRDGGVLVLPVAHFNRSLAERTAAFMAIGDSGMVFRYPFLTEKIQIDEIEALVVTETLAKKLKTMHPPLAQKIVLFNPPTDNNNGESLDKLLLERGIRPAGILPAKVKPHRGDLQTG